MILVEIDVTQKQKDYITIKDSAINKRNQVVEYEWKPTFCETCQKVGYQCKPKAKKQWQPKPP